MSLPEDVCVQAIGDMIPKEGSKCNVETMTAIINIAALDCEQLNPSDENERAVIMHRKNDNQRTYGNAADLHAKGRKMVDGLTCGSRLLLKSLMYFAHCPSNRFAFALLQGSPMESLQDM
jgi:hypothetical protein